MHETDKLRRLPSFAHPVVREQWTYGYAASRSYTVVDKAAKSLGSFLGTSVIDSRNSCRTADIFCTMVSGAPEVRGTYVASLDEPDGTG